MNRKRLISSAVGLAFAGILLLAPGCERRSPIGPRVEAASPGSTPEEKSSTPPKAKEAADAPAKAAPPAAKEAIEALGAAAWLPEDAAFFSASFRLRERVEALARSRAVGKLAALPLVQMLLAQARSQPAYALILTRMEENALIGDGVKLAGEALSSEVFIWGGEAWVPFQLALQRVYLDLAILGFGSGLRGEDQPRDRELANTMIQSTLAGEKDLRCPPVILGFRLSKPDEARAYLERALKEIEGRLPIAKEKLGGGEHHVLRLSGKMLPPHAREEMSAQLRSAEVPEERIAKLVAYVDSLTLAVTAGLRGDYLLLTVGPDTRHLERLGEGPSLAGSKAFAPVLARMKKGLLSLGYVHPRLNLLQKLDAGATATNLREVIDALPKEKIPDGLPARLEKDARALIDDLNRFLPDAAPLVTASFIERGIESFAFGARGTSLLETGKPLAITARAGPSPHAAFAARPRPVLEDYRVAARWARTAYSYFEDHAVPKIPQGKRKEFESFQKLFLPAIGELHEITETLFLPSIDGGEEMLVLDAEGTLPIWPVDGRRLERPILYPRPAVVIEVKDPEKLRRAFSRYRESLNRFFAKASADLGAKRFEIPEPATRPHAGGTLYTYEVPRTPLGPDLEPHAVLAEKWLVLSLFPAQSKAMLESKWEPPETAIALKAPAGRVVRADLERWTRLVIEDGSIVAAELAKEGRLPPDQIPFIQLHLTGVGDALRALRTYTSRTYDEEGLEVHHSWLEIRDLEDA